MRYSVCRPNGEEVTRFNSWAAAMQYISDFCWGLNYTIVDNWYLE
jgi:hypothetical protein